MFMCIIIQPKMYRRSEDVVGSAGGSLMLPAVENHKAADGQQLIYSDPHSWSQWALYICGPGFRISTRPIIVPILSRDSVP